MYDFAKIINRHNTNSSKWDKYAGKGILPMWVADMDFKVAEPIIEALRQQLDHGIFGYSNLADKAKSAIADYLEQSYSWQVNDINIIWLPSLVVGINLVSKVFTQPNQAIMTFPPIYPPFLKTANTIGRKLIKAELTYSQGRVAQFDFEKIEKNIIHLSNQQPRLILLCNPHNPVGRIWRQDELMQLLELAVKYDLIVCSDEIHCDLVLEPNLQHIPFATLNSEARARTITLMSPSKTYNLPGLGCSYAIIENPELLKQLNQAMRGLYSTQNIMGLTACVSAYTQCQEWRKELLTYLRKNRDYISSRLASVTDIRFTPPEATYLAWLDVREFCNNRQIASPLKFFEDRGLGLSDGAEFGANGFLRLNFACSEIILKEAMDIITSC